jgi:hypothetical protein
VVNILSWLKMVKAAASMTLRATNWRRAGERAVGEGKADAKEGKGRCFLVTYLSLLARTRDRERERERERERRDMRRWQQQ